MEEQKLKIGDKVKRIKCNFGNLKVGDIRIINKISSPTGSYIEFKNDLYGYDSRHFQKIEEDNYPIYYKKMDGEEIKSIGIITEHQRVLFDMSNPFIWTIIKNDNPLKENEESIIDESEFNILMEVWNYAHFGNDHIETITANKQGYTKNTLKGYWKESFTPKTQYQLYSADNGIAIYGYSTKSKNELADFIEGHGRKKGFRILNIKGNTTGFIHPSLLNKLSYHIKNI